MIKKGSSRLLTVCSQRGDSVIERTIGFLKVLGFYNVLGKFPTAV